MIKPSQADLKALFTFLESQSRDFRPICRWLVLGPELARTILADHTHAPTLDEVLDLVRWVEERAPELGQTVSWLVAASAHCDVLQRELQLDALMALEASSWTHPVQVLPRPRCANQDLLEACRRRRKKADGDTKGLLAKIEEKLLRAVQIDDRARRRRLEQQRKAELADVRKDSSEPGDHEVH